MDMSLDELISRNKTKMRPPNSRGRSQNSGGVRRNNSVLLRNNKTLQNNNARANRMPGAPRSTQNGDSVRGPTFNKIKDARLKIIQKNRQRLTDAREKLSELAKQTDARTKIKRRREEGINPLQPRRGDRPRIDRPRAERPRIERPQPSRTNFGRIGLSQAPVLQRSFRNNNPPAPDMRDASSLIRCTIDQSMSDYTRPPQMFPEDVDMPLAVRPHSELSGIKVVTQNEYTDYRHEYLSSSDPLYADPYIQPVFNRQADNYRGIPMARSSGARMSQEMRARLDTPAKPSMTYSYPQAPQSPPLPQGHRIVVSNLHSSVTHEDIKELFEDIGPLVTSRLVRAGTAEVIYKYQKDAKKAVEAYHNRQLDGQPMKCLLVNSRSPPGSSGALRSSNIPVTPKFPSSSKSMVVPDLSAIHKALFTNK